MSIDPGHGQIYQREQLTIHIPTATCQVRSPDKTCAQYEFHSASDIHHGHLSGMLLPQFHSFQAVNLSEATHHQEHMDVM